jgi:Short C-terminal domain
MGLIGGMARTAVVAGTATAVSNRVSRRQANRWGQQDQAAYYESQYAQPAYAQPQSQYAQPAYAQPQYAQPQYTPPAPPPAPPPAASSGDPMIEKLRQLAELKNQGILTEEEFAAQKARILAS